MIKSSPVLFVVMFCFSVFSNAQVIDTLAFQDFEVTPATPVWSYTGPVVYNSGTSAANAAPPSSPIGIGGSRAWETTTNSSGLALTFGNVAIPSGYDTVRAVFKIAAMNLGGSTGGPDDLDWILVAYNTDGGSTFSNRIRIRGAANNNSFWPYTAAGVARAYYTPVAEVVFQPVNSGLQLQDGIATCELVFPGSITQLQLRITARSSSSSDTWLIDNVLLIGEKSCQNTSSSISQTACKKYDFLGQSYTSSGVYTHIIPNSSGCDSTITLNLTIDTVDVGVNRNGLTLNANAVNASFQWLDCDNNFAPINGATAQVFTVAANGSYAVAITQGNCTDTSVCITVNDLGMADMAELTSCFVFPNPAQDWMEIRVKESLMGAHYMLLDGKGITILAGKIEDLTTAIEINDLVEGIYFLTIDGDHPAVQKVVKF
jgi:hypothetical protein